MSGIQPAAATPSNAAPPDAAVSSQSRRSGNSFWQRARCHRSFVAGGVLTMLMISAALLSLVWTPWPAYEIDMAHKLNPPSALHWLGTDTLGRDIVSLLLVGARSSIMVGIIAVGIGLVFGVSLGLVAAARRGWVEEVIMRLSDFTFAFPALLSAIMLAAVAGPGMLTSITAIGIFQIPLFVRISRGSRKPCAYISTLKPLGAMGQAPSGRGTRLGPLSTDSSGFGSGRSARVILRTVPGFS